MRTTDGQVACGKQEARLCCFGQQALGLVQISARLDRPCQFFRCGKIAVTGKPGEDFVIFDNVESFGIYRILKVFQRN